MYVFYSVYFKSLAADQTLMGRTFPVVDNPQYRSWEIAEIRFLQSRRGSQFDSFSNESVWFASRMVDPSRRVSQNAEHSRRVTRE